MWRVAMASTCIAAAWPTEAGAQSLQDLYDAARAYDAGYLGARALADSAQYRVDQAHALRRPTVGLTVVGGRSTSDTPTADTRTRAATATLTGTQPLFNRANDATIAQADRSLEQAGADLQLAEQDLIVRLAQAYFDVLAAQDTLATANANKTAIAEQLASAKRNFEVGTATITDTREAQARYDLATSQEIAADNDLRTKRIALDQLVGRSNVIPKPLAVPVRLPPLAPNNVDDWASQTDASPSVRKAVVALDIAKLETEKARAGHLPTVDLNGSYAPGTSRTTGTQNLNSAGQSIGGSLPVYISGATSTSNVNVTLRMPLFSGFAVQDRVKETLLLENQAQNNLEAARRGTAQTTRQAFFGVQSLQAQVAALEAAESSSQLALDATQLGYRVGVRVNIDVLNAQSQLYTTRRDLAQARYNVLINGLKLKQAAGSLQPSDVGLVDQLLAR
jgi:outer membrane protein